MESFILVSQRAQLSHYAALLYLDTQCIFLYGQKEGCEFWYAVISLCIFHHGDL